MPVVRLRHLEEVLGVPDARVVHHHVDSAGRLGGLDRLVEVLLVCDVTLHEHRLRVSLVPEQLVGRRTAPLRVFPNVGDDDCRGAVLCEPSCDTATDT